jgi:enoyl-CoA hydratase/carnithine racemase
MTSATPQIRMRQVSSAYWIATFDHRPINLIDPDTIRELDALVTRLEVDPDVRVIVFDSADPDFYLAHYDVLVDKQETISMPRGRSGMHPWLDVLTRLSRLPAVTVASIRGRARGAGSEFVLACDVRFASRERAVLGQFEVGIGAVPGGGPMARLPRLVGRGRALEILLGADDFPGELAERYGYVNRAVPDNELDAFVDAFARRIAGFDKRAIAGTKAFVDAASLPEDAEFPAALDSFFESVARDGTRQRVIGLVGEGLQQHGDVELDLGRRVGRHDHDESRAG